MIRPKYFLSAASAFSSSDSSEYSLSSPGSSHRVGLSFAANAKIIKEVLLILLPLQLLALLLSPVCAADILDGQKIEPSGVELSGVEPSGAVLLVVDGLGASYVYPEYRAYALDGSLLPGDVLFNLTGGGARVLDVRVPVPETTKSHSVLITGSQGADPEHMGPTIFDAAHSAGYLCLAVLERGDSMPVLQEMDAVLYLSDNSLHGAEPVAGIRAGMKIESNISAVLQGWRDVFSLYTVTPGVAGYAGYDAWALDCAAALVQQLGGRHYVLMVNVGAVDSAGQNLGPDGYRDVIAALDAPLGRLEKACLKSNVLLAVTADHGMVFPDARGRGGHSAAKYASRIEALRVPLVLTGPGVEELNLAGLWSEADIAPTLLSILNISSGFDFQGESMPLCESYNLRVTGAPADLALIRGEERLASCAGGGECIFQALPRGLYSLKAGGQKWDVVMNGDVALDLGKETEGAGASAKPIIGSILILAINLAGIVAIVRIWRGDR